MRKLKLTEKEIFEKSYQLEASGEIEELIEFLEETILEKPDQNLYPSLANQLLKICDWKKYEDLVKRGVDLVHDQTPFASLVRTNDPVENLQVAKTHSGYIERFIDDKYNHKPHKFQRKNKTKLNIGYYTYDLYNHPVTQLTMHSLSLHDRKRFNVHYYSAYDGLDKENLYKNRIKNDVDYFSDISEMSDYQAYEKIVSDGIDILIDLHGYTWGGRSEIIALKPAPIIVSWLGFPGSMGSKAHDYIVTDKILTPPTDKKHYTEKFIYMPHQCQMNRPFFISDDEFKRENLNLPEDKIVFSSFNNNLKIRPDIFETWLNILNRVPGSVLWLLKSSDAAKKNLLAFAKERGMPSYRIIFSDMIAFQKHANRVGLADIALDTAVYNGGISTSIALWAGVPVITLEGKTYISRMTSSILHNLGLDELRTNNLKEYEELAVELALNTKWRSRIREKISKNKYIYPLFDNKRYIKNLEKAFENVWERYLAGSQEDIVEVKDIGKESRVTASPETFNYMGIYYGKKNDMKNAIASFKKAVKANPRYEAAFTNLGTAYTKLNDFKNAQKYFHKALEINSEDQTAKNNYAGLLIAYANGCFRLGKTELAEEYYRESLKLDPSIESAKANLAILYEKNNDWDELDKSLLDIDENSKVHPFFILSNCASRRKAFDQAKVFTSRLSKKRIGFRFNKIKSKLNIGYMGGNFSSSPTGMNILGVLNSHTLNTYYYSSEKLNEQKLITNKQVVLRDVSSFGDDEAANIIFADEIDLLIDLKGLSKGNRIEILAHKPSPIQTLWLGYSGTTGADFIDYILLDKYVVPKEHKKYFSEKVVYLPGCYFPFNDSLKIAEKKLTRRECGLPEAGFIFSSFVSNYKIDRAIFDAWIDILLSVKNSYLWLLEPNGIARKNLLRHAKLSGVGPERIIFAKFIDKADHLKRLELADLALDTVKVNGHTTTVDALSVGVPVLTTEGSSILNRVSGSMLSEIKMHELIAQDLDSYKRKAVELANSPKKLSNLKSKLKHARAGSRLFGTKWFTKGLEKNYINIWQRWKQQ